MKNWIHRNRGLLWLLLTEFLASIMGLAARYLQTSLPNGNTYHPLQIISWRMTITFAACVLCGWWKKVPDSPWGRQDLRGILRARGAGGFLGVVGFYYALSALPLPDATVISFLVPTLVGIACSIIPAIREPFTRVERLSALVSFIGVILIARPAFLRPIFPWLGSESEANDPKVPGVSESARALAVVVAFAGVCGASAAYTTLRWLGHRTHPLIPVIYFNGVASIGSILCLVFVPFFPSLVLPQTGLEWGIALGLSASGLLMQWGLTIGMQLEKGGRGSQMIYVQLVFALILEWMVWGDLPTGLSLFGILLIISSVTAVNVFKEAWSEEQRALLSHEEAP